MTNQTSQLQYPVVSGARTEGVSRTHIVYLTPVLVSTKRGLEKAGKSKILPVHAKADDEQFVSM
jgi:hypothetical protein